MPTKASLGILVWVMANRVTGEGDLGPGRFQIDMTRATKIAPPRKAPKVANFRAAVDGVGGI